MKYGQVDGVGKKISRLVMGVDNQTSFEHACEMFDDFVERGGNAFDTAYVYGGGKHEKLLGQWIRARDVREDVVVTVKGAHTPLCFPDKLTEQFNESLDRLQIEYADLYFMHRDNPDVPVGEFVDVMNEHCRAGRMKAFGGSNWTIERVRAANAYAESKGKRKIGIISNNFSLADMVDPVWSGCVAASNPESMSFLKETGIALFSWSSQARGFFVDGRAAPDKKEDKELVRCWYSDDNFERLRRARELAGKKGVLAINIALAYVLEQPFKTFALFGPRKLEETASSMPGLDVKLSAAELAYLDLGRAKAR